MAYSPITVANSFLKIARDHKTSLTPMKLQKLVYLAHGWNLAIHNEPLINYQVEAWKYGPVIAPLYYKTREYGASPILSLIPLNPPEDGEHFLVPDRDRRSLDLLNRIWEVYGDLNGIELSALTHQQNTPWYQTWYTEGGKETMGKDIDPDLIKRHFIDLGLERAEQ